VLLTRLNDSRKAQMQALVTSGQVAGLVVIGQLTWHEHLNRLFHAGLAFSVWGAALPDAAYPVVGGDNEQGGYLAAAHLLSRGCKKIAFLGDIEHPEAGLRYAGYLRAHREAGVTPDARLRQSVLFGEPMLMQVVQDWLSQDLAFDGVFVTSDVAAIALISALNARGIDVPRDVKVVGYDDIEMAGHVFPSLTSIRQPTKLAGKALVTLLNEVQSGQARRSVILPTELVERDSTR
jgi:DNA-binding LacI/PurR family transcriptional regulator